MDKETASKIIRETFNNSFDKDRFIRFAKELFNYYEPDTFIYRGNFIPDAFDPQIKTLERVGKYTDPDGNKIDILIVQLKRASSIERARTMQRNFIAWYLNGSRGGELKDAAIVAFVAPDHDDWRFSLVKMDYHLEESESGKVKTRKELTPARRWSFLVGKNENSHTAQKQLLEILQNDSDNKLLQYDTPLFSELEQAFNIEKVTKEFFEKYRELFINVKEALEEIVKTNQSVRNEFEAKSIDTVDFAKKLLGQIVFLYFLQKKGWFGVPKGKNWGEGDKHFLRHLQEKAEQKNKNFFNDYLEPLFYQALRYDRSADDDYFSQFDCKIPFLNGGLFDPMNDYDWINTDVVLPNDVFANESKTKEGDIGTGILDVFDRYNFTVKEDEPLEKDVAVDPEMLGRAYEKFNAIRTDNYDEYLKALKSGKKGEESKFNKQYGVYYTPREIVHYMCQESLTNYLYTEVNSSVQYEENQASQSKLFGKPDPEQLKLSANTKEIISKEDIETLIKFGETAVEHDSRVATKGIETKSYSFKLPESIRQNAKLIDEKLATIRVCDPAVGSGAFPVGMMSEIIRTRNALTPYIENNNKRNPYNFKRHAVQSSLYGVDIDPGAIEIAKLRLWLSLVVDEEERATIQPLPNLDYKIVQGNSLLGVEKNLFNQELFSKLEELKPLYFDETSASKKKKYKKQIDDLISEITNGHKEFDFEVYFSEVFHEKQGFDVLIANPPYGAEMSKRELGEVKRNLISTKNTNSAAVFIDYGINQKINDRGTLTFIVPKSLLFSEGWFDLVKAMLGKVSILVDVEKAFENVKLEQVVFLYGKTIYTNSYLARKFLDNRFVRTIRIQNELISKYTAWPCDVSEEEIKIAEKATSNSAIDWMRDLSETKRGMPLQRFLRPLGEYRVIGGKNIFKYGVIGTKGFLTLEDVEQNRKKISFLSQPKIISQNIVAHIQKPRPRIVIMATLDLFGQVFSVDTVNNTLLTSDEYDLRYILAIMNCRFSSWFAYKFIYCSAIRTMHFDDYYVGKIPVAKLNKEKQQPINDLVNKILDITKDDDYLKNLIKQAKVREYEKQIDQLVYKLYDLTPDEIAIIEDGKKNI